MGNNKTAIAIFKITITILTCFSSIQANPVTGQENQRQGEFVFKLEYQPYGFDTAIDMRELPREKTFEKEPSFEGSEIFRGQLQTGTEEEDYTGFIWDKRAGKIVVRA